MNFISRARTFAYRSLINRIGYRTRRKIIVIESDDWGSVRMPCLKSLNKCKEAGYQIDNHPFERYDTIASEIDLSALYEVLTRFKDKNGAHPVITANSVVANPDFEKIAASNYQEYHFELFTKTIERYYPNDNVLKLWKEGIAAGIFYPQYHSREHFNVPLWLEKLQAGDKDTLFAFGLNMVGITPQNGNGNNLMLALNHTRKSQFDWQCHAVKEGIELFNTIFGYYSDSFIAPCYTWSSDLEPILYQNKIKIIQSNPMQIAPVIGAEPRHIKHCMGEQNPHGQFYTIRNCLFEPSITKKQDIVEQCLLQIHAAFLWHKPAIITSHRINYIGTLDEKNRIENLNLLDVLLTQIIKKWPNVEFMTTSQLGKLLSTENQ